MTMPLNLVVKRNILTQDTTLGILTINGQFFGHTLEDAVRKIKIKGETAIPLGNYKVKVTHSSRFGRRMPLIYNMKDYSVQVNDIRFNGVRFHGGNTHLNTEGCILIAKNVYINKPSSFKDKLKRTIMNWIQGSLEKELTALLDNGQEHNLSII